MAKEIDNARLYDMGEVWIAEDLDTPDPDEGEEFASGWSEVGLMDGDDGMTTSRDVDKSKKYAWGNILVRESRQKFTMAKKFAVLEDNDTTRALIWPGSTPELVIEPKPKPIKMAFVTRDGDQVKREFTRKHALVDVDGDITENETDLTKVTLTADIYPDVTTAGNEYLTVQQYDETAVGG